MSVDAPILVTGAAGRVGGVGRDLVAILRKRGLPVRALVRREDERANALRETGAGVEVGDMTRAGDVERALAGCRRMYFGMSVSASYLEATVVAAAVLASPAAHIGKIYELTGPRTLDMNGIAAEYSEALGRTITYVDVPLEQWRDRELRRPEVA